MNDEEKAEFHFEKAIELSPENVPNREKLYDYYIAENEPEKAFNTASEGLKYSPLEPSLLRGMITSSVLMEKVELLDPYFFNAGNTPEMNKRLHDILSEETASLKIFINNKVYDELNKRILRLESTVPVLSSETR